MGNFQEAGFNSREVEPDSNDFTPVPEGEYVVCLRKSEMKGAKSGSGMVLHTEFEIVDGPFKNRLLWHYFNVQNPNIKAQEIGRAQLSQLCYACGNPDAKGSEELHNKPIRVKVGLAKRNDTGEPTNKIKAFVITKENQPQPSGNGQPEPVTAGAAAGSADSDAPPWEQ